MVPTIENMVKEGINDMWTKCNAVEKAITHHKGKNKIDAINKADKPESSQGKKDKSISNETKKGMALDKLRSLYKSRYY